MKINSKILEKLRDSKKIKILLSDGLGITTSSVCHNLRFNKDNSILTTKKSLEIISEYFNLPENEIITE